MGNINKKRLNNKGFTLIELLAVVVILAVVMGIAMTSVLSAMNKSRGGSLEDSAKTMADGFTKKYTESLVDGVPSKVYGDVANVEGYNFQSNATYYLTKELANEFNITEKGYAFVDSDSDVNANAPETAPAVYTELAVGTKVSNSFVRFDVSTGRFVVCLFANPGGSYFVDNYKTGGEIGIFTKEETTTVEGETKTNTVNLITANENTMFACSNGTKSW